MDADSDVRVTGILLIVLGFLFAIVIFGGGLACWTTLVLWPPDSAWWRLVLLFGGWATLGGGIRMCYKYSGGWGP